MTPHSTNTSPDLRTSNPWLAQVQEMKRNLELKKNAWAPTNEWADAVSPAHQTNGAATMNVQTAEQDEVMKNPFDSPAPDQYSPLTVDEPRLSSPTFPSPIHEELYTNPFFTPVSTPNTPPKSPIYSPITSPITPFFHDMASFRPGTTAVDEADPFSDAAAVEEDTNSDLEFGAFSCTCGMTSCDVCYILPKPKTVDPFKDPIYLDDESESASFLSSSPPTSSKRREYGEVTVFEGLGIVTPVPPRMDLWTRRVRRMGVGFGFGGRRGQYTREEIEEGGEDTAEMRERLAEEERECVKLSQGVETGVMRPVH